MGAQPAERILGKTVPLSRGIEAVARIGITRADRILAAKRVVQGTGIATAPPGDGEGAGRKGRIANRAYGGRAGQVLEPRGQGIGNDVAGSLGETLGQVEGRLVGEHFADGGIIARGPGL